METLLTECGIAHKLTPTTSESIRVSLQWQQPGLLRRMLNGYVDLDLGCYYQLANGEKNLIDCLQFSGDKGGSRHDATRQGCYDASPFIWHSGDADGNADSSVEELLINPKGLAEISRLMIYAYIFEGPARWRAVNPTLRISVPGCDDVVIKVEPEPGKRFIALAGIKTEPDGSIVIENLGTSHDGHADCDRAYGWGFAYRGK